MAKRHLQLSAVLNFLCYLLCLGTRGAATERSLKVVYAVNAGGDAHTDIHGIHYEADPLHNKIGTGSDYGNHLREIGRAHVHDEVLYRTERYHTGTFGYDLPLSGDGDYALIMKFCEVYFSAPNMKIFDVVLNNQHIIVSELDIYHQVGKGNAHEEYAYFTVSNGRLYYKDEESEVRHNMLRLEFVKSPYDNPKINAFALLKGDVDKIPRLSPMTDDILPMDADMAVFHDRISADSSTESPQATAEHSELVDNDDDSEEQQTKVRKTSGPRHPDPYSLDDSSVMLPVFIAIGAFIPLLFCLCKL